MKFTEHSITAPSPPSGIHHPPRRINTEAVEVRFYPPGSTFYRVRTRDTECVRSVTSLVLRSTIVWFLIAGSSAARQSAHAEALGIESAESVGAPARP